MDFNELIKELNIALSQTPNSSEKWISWLIEQLTVLSNHIALFLILILTLFILQRLVFLLSA